MCLAAVLLAGFCTMSVAKVARKMDNGKMVINHQGEIHGIASATVRRVSESASNTVERVNTVVPDDQRRKLQPGIASAAVRRVGQSASTFVEPKDLSEQSLEASEVGVSAAALLFRDSGEKADMSTELADDLSTNDSENDSEDDSEHSGVEEEQKGEEKAEEGAAAGDEEGEKLGECADIGGYKCAPMNVRLSNGFRVFFELEAAWILPGTWEGPDNTRFRFKTDVSDCARVCSANAICKAFETYKEAFAEDSLATTCQFMNSGTRSLEQTPTKDLDLKKGAVYSKACFLDQAECPVLLMESA